MRTFVVMLATAAAIAASGCGATARQTTVQPSAFPALTSGTITFNSKDHGKDADSALAVQLLRNNAELAAEIRAVGTKFDDHASSGPFAFSLAGPFTTNDISDGELRLRLAADGNDDWTFDVNMTLRFADGTSRNFMWRDIRLDRNQPERVLTLAGGRL
jgi:uncharacterized protein YceK